MAHSGYQSTRRKTGAIYHSAASQGPSWHCLAPSQDSAQDPPRPVSREQPDHKPSTGSTPQTASIVRSPRGRTQQDNLNSARPHTHPALSTGRTSTDSVPNQKHDTIASQQTSNISRYRRKCLPHTAALQAHLAGYTQHYQTYNRVEAMKTQALLGTTTWQRENDTALVFPVISQLFRIMCK